MLTTTYYKMKLVSTSVLLISLLCALCFAIPCLGFANNMCYIVSDDSAAPVVCPNTSNPCVTVTEFARNPTAYVQDSSHVDLVFLPGNHNLNSLLTMEDYYEILFFSLLGRKSSVGVTISSEGLGRLYISEIPTVRIEHIKFVGFSNARFEAISDSLLVNNCSFIDGNGTALELEHNHHVTVSNSHFISNVGTLREVTQTASTNELYSAGGAIFLLGNTHVSIETCSFTNNSAEVGGVIYSTSLPFVDHESVFNIRNCTFFNNRIQISPEASISYNDGAVVYCEIATVCRATISYSVFKKNSNMMQGLALFSIKGSDIIIRNSIFSENYGAIINAESSSIITLWKDNLSENKNAHSCGGLFLLTSSSLTISGCNFVDNSQYAISDGGAIVCAESSKILTVDSKFQGNYVNSSGGVYFLDYRSSLVTNQSIYISNSAGLYGGVLVAAKSSNVTASNNVFMNNSALQSGGVIAVNSEGCIVHLLSNRFINNHAKQSGGALWITYSDLHVLVFNSSFDQNHAGIGGVLESTGASILIDSSNFSQNYADDTGGVVAMYIVTFSITRCTFSSNAAKSGGVFFVKGVEEHSLISNTLFVQNKAKESGAAFYGDSIHRKVECVLVNFMSNYALLGTIYCQYCRYLSITHAYFRFNNGSLFSINSKVVIEGITHFFFSLNLQSNISVNYQGGAITCIQSELSFNDANVLFEGNQAEQGGAMVLTETKLHINGGRITLFENSATISGGGLYCFQSEVIVEGRILLMGNKAGMKGGAIHMIGTRINIPIRSYSYAFRALPSTIIIVDNGANEGGGIYFEGNSKMYVSKEGPTTREVNEVRKPQFINNTANHGGAIFIADGTDSGTCSSMSSESVFSTAVECTLQVFALHEFEGEGYKLPQNFRFANNTAYSSGSDIYGGLLDRCQASLYAEARQKYKGKNSELNLLGTPYLKIISNTNEDMISSDPVKICFCINKSQNCSLTDYSVDSLKGEMNTIEIVAVDQVEHAISASVRLYLSSEKSGLGEGQLTQYVSNTCSEIRFEVFSPNDSEEVTIYAKGPCKDIGVSRKKVFVSFLKCTCPIGFKENAEQKTRCECVCNDVISSLLATCNSTSKLIIRRSNFWLSYLQEQNGFIVYPECPFDYCYSPSLPVRINFNVPCGEDSQCKNNRTGKLCGACQPGYSSILGSSRCLVCSNHWIILIFVFAFAGVVLVAIILYFNLTVAIGTINGLMFYANIVMANREIYIEDTNFLSVFISWLNLDLGIESCLYNGMDSYAKVWLRFVFPLYIIVLVVIIIFVSEHWGKFARLLTYKNPVATLATLILLSYTQLLRTIISSFSFAILEYPDGSRKVSWLPDANINYFSGKHAALLLATTLVVIIGLAYTMILFSWQWILQLNDRKYLKWIRNPRINSFMDAYHGPYKFKYRYWTGLLLLARVALYLVASVVQNVFADARINLVFTAILLIGICIFRGYMRVSTLYKMWLVDILELTFYFNICIFTVSTLYIRSSGKGNQHTLAIMSVGFTVAAFVSIMIFHIWTYCLNKFSIWKRSLSRLTSLTTTSNTESLTII